MTAAELVESRRIHRSRQREQRRQPGELLDVDDDDRQGLLELLTSEMGQRGHRDRQEVLPSAQEVRI